MESRSIAKWQQAGWELVDQRTGALHTTLNLRRPKPKVPWIPIGASVGVLLGLAAVGAVVSALQGGDAQPSAAPQPTVAAAPTQGGDAEPSAAPTPPVVAAPRPPVAAAPGDVPLQVPSAGAPTRGAPQTGQALTTANSDELAALLAVPDYCDGSIGTFAATYEGMTIQFDGSIAAVSNHEGFDTRYDILLAPGDKGPESALGPAFQFQDVGILDLAFTGPNVPDAVGTGDLLRLTAQVVEFNQTQCLFLLDPVSTEIR